MAVAAAIAAVTAIVSGALGATLGTAIAIGFAAASVYMGMSIATPKLGASVSQAERKQLIRSGTAAKQIVLGETLVSGVWLYAEEERGGNDNYDGTYEEWLFNAIGIAGHAISRVDQVYFDDERIETYEDKANYAIHINPTQTDAYLLEHGPSWTEDMIGRGTTWARVSMLFDSEKYTNGIPTPRFKLKGCNEIYDPRIDQTGYSNNAALVTLWVLQTLFNYSDDEIIWTGFGGFIPAANLCDEQVVNPNGTMEKRYTVNGSCLLDEKRGDILQDLLRCSGAELVRIGGKVGILPAAYYGPATFTINESDIISDIDVQPEPARAHATNVVGGTFIDPSQNYVETDYPAIKDEEAIARDGEEIKTDLNFRFVTSAYQAQRLGHIEIKRAQAGAVLKFRMNLKGLYCRRGRVVRLDVPSVGLTGEFRVVSCDSHLGEGVNIELHQESADIYDDAVGQEFIPPPLTNLPPGGIAAPTNVQFLAESLGEVVQGKLVWQTRAPQTAFNEIQLYQILTGGVEQLVQSGQTVGNSYQLNGLPVANYKAYVRSVSSEGRRSPQSSTNFVVDTPQVPSNVDIDRSNWSIHLKPQFAVPVPVGTLFEFWYLADNASYISNPATWSEVDIARAEKVHTGSSFNHSTLSPDRWQHYWIRTVNIYGKSDFLYIRTGTTREQDLITTVVERLVAIEVESQNWDDDSGTGYKLFSPASEPYTMPDGTVLDNPDGLLVANNIVARGHMVAETLTFVSDDAIPPGINNSNTVKVYRQSSPPSGVHNVGDTWYNTANANHPSTWSGASWVSVQDGDIALAIDAADQALVDAAQAQATANGKITTYYQG
uniref:phage tail tip protein J-related protein n=1 Tax=Vibrio sp. H11 TaxID=2565928 RepID=UPI0010A67DBF